MTVATISTGFFDTYPRFYETGNTRGGKRLNARYECLIEQNRRLIEGRVVLDIGSHDGRWSFAALAVGARKVIGIEPRPELVQASMETFLEYGIDRNRFEFHVGSASDVLGQQHIVVDTVFLFGVYYHIHDHVRMLQQIWNTRASAIIIDTQLSPEAPGDRRYSQSVSFITEKITDISNAADEIYPGAGFAIVGHPSASAVRMLLRAFQFAPTDVSWDVSIAKWGDRGMEDYANVRRGAFVGVKPEGRSPHPGGSAP